MLVSRDALIQGHIQTFSQLIWAGLRDLNVLEHMEGEPLDAPLTLPTVPHKLIDRAYSTQIHVASIEQLTEAQIDTEANLEYESAIRRADDESQRIRVIGENAALWLDKVRTKATLAGFSSLKSQLEISLIHALGTFRVGELVFRPPLYEDYLPSENWYKRTLDAAREARDKAAQELAAATKRVDGKLVVLKQIFEKFGYPPHIAPSDFDENDPYDQGDL